MSRFRLGGRRVALAALALIVAGCGSSKSTTYTTASTPTSTPPATESQSSTTAAALPNQISANLSEYNISLSQATLAPGTYTFAVKNNGSASHAFAITGPGVGNQRTANLQPGQSALLSVNIQAGMYDIWSPVDNDKSQGMDAMLMVGTIGHSGNS